MNLNFADINQMFLQMAKPSEGKNANFLPKLVSGQKTNGHPDFSAYLQKANLSKMMSDSKKGLDGQGLDVSKLEKIFSDYLSGETGRAFVEKLHQMLLQLSEGNIQNISINPEGLAILAGLLEKAGFNKHDLEELMADLSQTGSRKISMDEVMDHLFQLPADSPEESKEETLLESSAQPFIISVLQLFAIPEDTISTILSEAERPGSFISLNQIIENLKELEKKSVYTQTSFSIKTADKADNSIFSLLDSLGMKLPQTNTAGTDTIFLKDLTAAFEAFANKQVEKNSLFSGDPGKTLTSSAVQGGETSFSDLVSSLFKHLDLQVRESKFSNSPAANLQSINSHISASRADISQPGAALESILQAGASQSDISQANAVRESILQAGFVQAGASQAEFVQEFMKNNFNGASGSFQKQADLSKGQLDMAFLDPEVKSEQTLKEIQALLSGRFKGGSENRSGFQQENTRPAKSFTSRANDQNQLSGGDVKPKDSLAGLEFLKTKNSFKNLPNYVTHQVGKSLVRAISQGENSLKIQLKPPELGRLVMHIDNTGNSMKVSIITETHAAREMLTANVNELRTVLSSAGISLESFDVDMNSNFRQSMADAKNQFNSAGGKKQNKENNDQTILSQNEIQGLDQDTSLFMQNGSLHYVA
ncbi:MAG: flagellar hook-length control protein FliK [Desulfotignum sp.]